jgi:VIT1/CCC1 family predicted Fe2+/Mn2+ transporter
MMPRAAETHLVNRTGWLRAAVLGANDGIVSTASLIVGVAAASTEVRPVLVAGVAGLVAGAMSMAAGEYVSVSSQSDTETADLARERRELAADPSGELQELAEIYEARGVPPDLALEVARALTERDALAAHARDELGITDVLAARPIQAALTSGAAFSIGAIIPLLTVFIAPANSVGISVSAAALLALALLGYLGALTGGAPPLRAVTRVVFWGAIALAATAGIGLLFHISA